MQRYLWVLVPALLSGCGLPPAVMIASYAADGVSYVATGKSVSDHGISKVTGRDCALWRVIKGEPVCKDEPTQRADPAPVETGQRATLPPGSEPAKVLAGRHRYVVLGSFADLHNAERLAAGHHDWRITVASVDGRLTHRVITGPLSDQEVARLQQRLAREDQPHAWEIAELPPGS
ncbi:MAG TPA: SPOR domain-containing protein [Stellaceae bacterium]|nr:SPOR domain-containing protein [Stellaceae bacterium]